MNKHYPKEFKESIHDFLSQPEQIDLLRNNDLDALFLKMYNSKSYGIMGITYVTELLYENEFLVENYVTKTYERQFRHINRKTFYFPKCKQIQQYSFAHNKHIEEINAPNALVAGSFAFIFCDNLRKVDLPKLKEFSESTFVGCELLKPEDVTVSLECKLKHTVIVH